MLRDITIGQHFPGNSLVHWFDPRLKLVLTVAYIVLLFAASNPLGLTLSILFLGVMYKVAKIPVKMIGKSLKPILPIVLTDAIEQLLKPLGKLHFPVHELAMMMSIALRFIPTLIEEADKIASAQKARGADFESGSLFQKAKALVPILVPLFISAFRRADELATAMECRCYHGGEGRTKLHVLQYQRRDYIALAGGAAM